MKHTQTTFTNIAWSTIFIFLVGFASCKKNESPTDVTDPSGTTARLKKVIKIEGPYTNTEELEYTNTNLVLSRRDSMAAVSPSGNYAEVFHIFFTYNANDEKPVKDSTVTKMYNGNNLTSSYSTVTYYYYDPQNKLTKSESFVANNLVLRKLFTYLNDKRIATYFKAYNDGTGGGIYFNDTISINSLNQTNEIINDANAVYVNGTSYSTYKYNFEFDNNKNPYFDLNIIKYGTTGTDSAYSFDQKCGPNNMINEASHFRINSDPYYNFSTAERTYNYNAAGYPTSAITIETIHSSVGLPVSYDTINTSYNYY